MYIVVLIIWAIAMLLWLFITYQEHRLNAILSIRVEWIINKQFDLLDKYAFKYMFEPNKHNWYMLKFSKEKDYT